MMTQDEMSKLESATGTEFDKKWLTLMIEHHQGAVTMAEQVLTTTEDKAVKRTAKSIVKAQKAEIKAMRRELSARHGLGEFGRPDHGGRATRSR